MNNGSNQEKAKQSMFIQLKNFFENKILRFRAPTLEESVTELIKEHNNDSDIHTEERAMLLNIVDFGEIRAYEVMVPRTYIVSINENTNYEELRLKFVSEGHTRLPVFRENIDEVIGFVHMKDFLPIMGKEKEFSLKRIIREIIYVPRSMKIIDLLVKMRQSGIHIAIVLDEYGGTEGLVTIEDIVEKIIGDIKDEHDSLDIKSSIVATEQGYLIQGIAKIEEVEDMIGFTLQNNEDSFETFGGYILSQLGRVPEIGEIIKPKEGVSIEILEADSRKIKLAKVVLEKNTVK